jgi:hypothetical protein
LTNVDTWRRLNETNSSVFEIHGSDYLITETPITTIERRKIQIIYLDLSPKQCIPCHYLKHFGFAGLKMTDSKGLRLVQYAETMQENTLIQQEK